MQYWLLKTEPEEWSWTQQVQSGKNGAEWNGVRNFQARNNLIKMKKGDLCFFYHSVSEKRIIGIVKVVKENYQDPTDKTNKFVAVDVKAKEKLKNPVTLEKIKSTKSLSNLPLIKQSRLSVMELKKSEWNTIIKMSK